MRRPSGQIEEGQHGTDRSPPVTNVVPSSLRPIRLVHVSVRQMVLTITVMAAITRLAGSATITKRLSSAVPGLNVTSFMAGYGKADESVGLPISHQRFLVGDSLEVH